MYHEKKSHDLDLQKTLCQGAKWNRDVQSARSIWRYFIQKAFAWDSKPYPSWKPTHIRPSGKGKSSSNIPWGDMLVPKRVVKVGGWKDSKSIPNDSRNKPWEVGHGKEMDVSENNGTPKSSILKGLSIINHPFWGTPIFGNTQMERMIFPTNFRGWQFASRASVSSKGGRNTTETTIQDGPKNQL